MKVKIRYNETVSQTKIICDTNVWYGFNQKKTTIIDKNHILIPTSLILNELATSEVMVYDFNLLKDAIKAIYEKGGPILQLDPIDYVLSQQDPNYSAKDRGIEKLLEKFSYLLSSDNKTVIDNKQKNEVIEKCKIKRNSTVSFAEFVNSYIEEIRKNINKGIGQKKHLEIDTTEINKEMVKSIFNEHVKDNGYTINWENFDWTKIDLFLKVTETYFKKLETTKGMKVSPNDAVDWLNMLYVSPDDKYLTFEVTWRKYIEEDVRIKHYLYEQC